MPKNIKTIIYVIIALIIIYVGYTLLKSPAEPQEPETIKIGVSSALTGPVATPGSWAIQGAELAIKESDENIELMTEDDQCNSVEGNKTVNKLINFDKLNSIFVFCSAALPGTVEITKDKAIVVYPSVKFVDQENYFTVYPDINVEMSILSKHIINEHDIKEIAQFYQADAAGESIKNAFVEAFEKEGGSVEIIESVSNFEIGDFRTSLLKVKNKKIPAIMVTGAPGNFVKAVQQVNELGLSVSIFSNSLGAENPIVIKNLGQLAEGIEFTSPYNAADIEGSKFYKLYRAKYESIPSIWSVFAYDAMNVLINIKKKCQDDYECQLEIIRSEKFSGPLGDFTLKNGSAKGRTIYLKKIEDGKFIIIKKQK